MLIRLTFLALLLPGCGNSSAPPPECAGTSCQCPAGESCDIGDSACSGSSCSLDCSDHNVCTGTCGASCSVNCDGLSTCEVTVGASGSVSCDTGTTCRVTCTGSCSVSCATGSICELECPADTAPHSVPGGGTCS